MPELSLVTMTITPPTPAGAESVISRSAVLPTEIRSAPTSAIKIVGVGKVAVAENTAGASVPTVALAVCDVEFMPIIQVVEAWPEPSVVALVGVTEPFNACQFTVSPETELPYWS